MTDKYFQFEIVVDAKPVKKPIYYDDYATAVAVAKGMRLLHPKQNIKIWHRAVVVTKSDWSATDESNPPEFA